MPEEKNEVQTQVQPSPPQEALPAQDGPKVLRLPTPILEPITNGNIKEVFKKLKMKKSDVSMVEVTPDFARYLLLNVIEDQRSVNHDFVNDLANDILSGSWRPNNPNPISIKKNREGYTLIDGQHRLWAVIKSGKPVYMRVAFDVTEEEFPVIDGGRKRSTYQHLRMMGHEWVNGAMVSTLRSMVNPNYSKKGLSELTLQNLVLFHREALEFVHTAFTGGSRAPYINIAPVKAVVARAFYSQDQNKLLRFVEVLKRGISNGKVESAGISLRDTLRNNDARLSSKEGRIWAYRLTQNALRYFLTGQEVKAVRGITEEQFEIPWPSKQAKREVLRKPQKKQRQGLAKAAKVAKKK